MSLKKIYFMLIIFLHTIYIVSLTAVQKSEFIVVLDPIILSHVTDKINFDAAEFCAKTVKFFLENKNPSIEVVILNYDKKKSEQFYHATVSNHFIADLYVAFCFSVNNVSEMNFYYYDGGKCNPMMSAVGPLEFLTPEQSYCKSHFLTERIIKSLYETVKNKSDDIIVNVPQGFPFKPFAGILSPACAVEICVPKVMLNHVCNELVGDALLEVIQLTLSGKV